MGKVVQQGVKTFEAALVDGHPDAPELAVPTFVEGDPFGRRGGDHMGVVGIGGSGRCRVGRRMFRWMLGLQQDSLDRMHNLISQVSMRQRQNTQMIEGKQLGCFSCSLSLPQSLRSQSGCGSSDSGLPLRIEQGLLSMSHVTSITKLKKGSLK